MEISSYIQGFKSLDNKHIIPSDDSQRLSGRDDHQISSRCSELTASDSESSDSDALSTSDCDLPATDYDLLASSDRDSPDLSDCDYSIFSDSDCSTTSDFTYSKCPHCDLSVPLECFHPKLSDSHKQIPSGGQLQIQSDQAPPDRDLEVSSNSNLEAFSSSNLKVPSDSSLEVSSTCDLRAPSDLDFDVPSDRDLDALSDCDLDEPSVFALQVSSGRPFQVSLECYRQVFPYCERRLISNSDNNIPLENNIHPSSYSDESYFEHASANGIQTTKTHVPSKIILKELHNSYCELNRHYLVLLKVFDNLGVIKVRYVEFQDWYQDRHRDIHDDINLIKITLKECFDTYHSLLNISDSRQSSEVSETDQVTRSLRVMVQHFNYARQLLQRNLHNVQRFIPLRHIMFH